MNLYYPQNGSFRVLVIADIQESKALSKEYQNMLLKEIKDAAPQLIVLLGDAIFGPVLLTQKRVQKVLASIVGLFDGVKIPFTFVFGNHDLDSIMSPQKQMDIYKSSKYCITPTFADRSCSHSYLLNVLSDSDEKILNLLFFDSGATTLTKYGISYKGPGEDTDVWARDIIQNSSIPCFAFQHVPILSIYNLLSISSKRTNSSVKGHGPYRGKWLSLLPEASGILGESPCPEWLSDDHQILSWSHSDALKAAVFGHDHKNAFEGIVNKITLFQTPCAGLNCYGNDSTRGIRLLDINRDGSFTSKVVFFNCKDREV